MGDSGSGGDRDSAETAGGGAGRDDGRLRGVVFDVDGTLVDTTYLHTLAWWESLLQYGHRVPMATIHRAVGMGSDRILDHLLGADRDRGDDEAMAAAHSAHYHPYLQRLVPMPGARRLLRACAEQGLTVALASSASGPELEALRSALDAGDDVVAAATAADDAERSKPDPDIVAAALDRTGLRAGSVVFVGDSVWDVEAAGRLDVPCVGLTCGGTSAAELEAAGAVAVCEDPAALLARLDDGILTGALGGRPPH